MTCIVDEYNVMSIVIIATIIIVIDYDYYGKSIRLNQSNKSINNYHHQR